MKNFEKYEKEIRKIGINNFAYDLKTNKPVSCNGFDCRGCEFIKPHLCSKIKTNWLYEEYQEPILTEKEKEYLSAVIKPFNISSIKKCNNCEHEFIRIELAIKDGQNRCESINLPYFRIGQYYNNMESDRKYTLEELGL